MSVKLTHQGAARNVASLFLWPSCPVTDALDSKGLLLRDPAPGNLKHL